MNIQAYIDSGKLEDYALGMLSAREAAEVEEDIARYPQLAQELRQIQEALARYAQESAKTPPPGLESRIWQALQTPQQTPQQIPAEARPPVKLLHIRPWLAAACIMLLFATSFLSFYFYNQWAASESALFAMQQEKEHLAGNLEAQQASYKRMESELALLSNAGTRSIPLKGMPEFPQARATIFWRVETADVYLKVNALPLPPQNKQYQLWAFVDGKPVDAGVFDMTDTETAMIKMKNFSRASAFAITLEDRGGKAAPEGAIYVMGTI